MAAAGSSHLQDPSNKVVGGGGHPTLKNADVVVGHPTRNKVGCGHLTRNKVAAVAQQKIIVVQHVVVHPTCRRQACRQLSSFTGAFQRATVSQWHSLL